MLKLDPNWKYYQRTAPRVSFVVLYASAPEFREELVWWGPLAGHSWVLSSDNTSSDLKDPIFTPLTYEQAEALVTLSYLGGQVGDE